MAWVRGKRLAMLWRGLSRLSSSLGYILLVLITVCLLCLSCILLLSQAVRTSKNQSLEANWNTVVIGVSYTIVLVVSIAFCLRRRIAVHRRLQGISKSYKTLGKGDVPDSVHLYITQEYARACLITYEALPKDGFQEGWGAPGSKYEDIQFRKRMLDTITEIDKLAHEVIPRHPDTRPHTRMTHHFRFIAPLLPKDDIGLSALHYYDSGIQLARHSSREPAEDEFLRCMAAADQIKKILEDCISEMQMQNSSVSTF